MISQLLNLIRISSLRLQGVYIPFGSTVSKGVKIGQYTRINNPSFLGPCDIGKVCAIGGRLVVRSSDHYTNYLNVQSHYQSKVVRSDINVAGKKQKTVRVGNGVWIGDSVIILKNVEIGNGAIIGAGSIVTKDIPAYGIAVGNPAKVIGYRYEKKIIEVIESINWWDWNKSDVKKNKELFETDLSTITKDDLLVLLDKLQVKK